MSKRDEEKIQNSERIFADSIDMVFPEPDRPLLEGPGPPVPWEQFMAETAMQTNYWLDHFGKDEVLPPPWEERLILD